MAQAQNKQAEWPASKVDLWPLSKIKPYKKNPKKHSTAQIELIAKSMVEDGVTAPIFVDESGVIIYGHARLKAAKLNGFDKYPALSSKCNSLR